MPDSYRIKSYYFSCPELQRIEQDPDLSFDGIVSIKEDQGNQVYLGYFSRNLSYWKPSEFREFLREEKWISVEKIKRYKKRPCFLAAGVIKMQDILCYFKLVLIRDVDFNFLKVWKESCVMIKTWDSRLFFYNIIIIIKSWIN